MLTKVIQSIFLVVVVGAMTVPSISNADTNIVAENDNDDVHIVWKKLPIDFIVPVGKQRLITFPGRVQVENDDNELTTDKVTIYNNNGTLYVAAHKTIKPVLIKVRMLKTGDVILVNLSAVSNKTSGQPIDIVLPSMDQNQDKADSTLPKPTITLNTVTLTRIAAQEFGYKRLASVPSNVSRAPMYTQKTVNIYYGSSVQAFPLASWRGNDLYVTAVELKNTLPQTTVLDPKNIIGNWQSASFYRPDQMRSLTDPLIPYNVLTAQGTKHDMTLLLVVSDKPFGEALSETNPYARKELEL